MSLASHMHPSPWLNIRRCFSMWIFLCGGRTAWNDFAKGICVRPSLSVPCFFSFLGAHSRVAHSSTHSCDQESHVLSAELSRLISSLLLLYVKGIFCTLVFLLNLVHGICVLMFPLFLSNWRSIKAYLLETFWFICLEGVRSFVLLEKLCSAGHVFRSIFKPAVHSETLLFELR